MKHTPPGPFSIGVRDLIGRPGEMRETTRELRTAEHWGEGLVAVPQGAQIDIDVRLESVHEGILVTGEAETHYAGECGRCLTPIEQSIDIAFQELFAYPGDEATDFSVQDDHVDLETSVRDAIVLALPFQPVCRPDCPGLEPETGERLDAETDRKPRENLDPRWAALASFAPEPVDDPGSAGTTPQNS